MSIQLLTLIVAWCGTPTPYRLEVVDVNVCRAKLIKCVNEAAVGKTSTCFEKTELGRQ